MILENIRCFYHGIHARIACGGSLLQELLWQRLVNIPDALFLIFNRDNKLSLGKNISRIKA